MHASQPPEEHDPKKCPDSKTAGEHKKVLIQGNKRNNRHMMIQHVYPKNIRKYAPK